MVDHKKSIKTKKYITNFLFTAGVFSILGTIGGLEVGTLSITEAILYLMISCIPIIFSVGNGEFEYQDFEEEEGAKN